MVICLNSSPPTAVVIGGGPAGLMAAEQIARAGFAVSIYDAMPSVGRKFLLAGVGGMNITHAENTARLLTRYAEAQTALTPFIEAFDGQVLREWVHELGIKTFVGSSQRVFPEQMKAAPLLRAWLHRLRLLGVRFYPRYRWHGWTAEGALHFVAGSTTGTATLNVMVQADVCVLALGGGSWSRLGSDGAWVPLLRTHGVNVADLEPANAGFETRWSDMFAERFGGTPLTTVGLSTTDGDGQVHRLRGEATISRYGLEGTTVYALSGVLRDTLKQQGHAQLSLDLLPDRTLENITDMLRKPRGRMSQSNFLRKQLKLTPVKIALLHEIAGGSIEKDPPRLAQTIKDLSITLTAIRPLDEAISSAGGVCFSAVNENLMLHHRPGVFCAGEMLNWDAPTGGYLLTACFATGRAAGLGAVKWLARLTPGTDDQGAGLANVDLANNREAI
jgi:uncharacterized flavoprotein (TIGR03862 family)